MITEKQEDERSVPVYHQGFEILASGRCDGHKKGRETVSQRIEVTPTGSISHIALQCNKISN